MQRISDEQVVAKLNQENFWWKSGSYRLELVARPYLNLLMPLLNHELQRAVIMMGPRRVGKTILIHHAIQRLLEKKILPTHICYISIDNPIYNHVINGGGGLETLLRLYCREQHLDPQGSDRLYVFFDEIQYLKNWEIHLKVLVDTYPKIQFLASGSAAAALKRQSNESGTGRFTDFLLPPLTFYEYLVLKGEEEAFTEKSAISKLNKVFIDYINFGGYPEIALSKKHRADLGRFVKSDIIDKVLLRDLPILYGIQDIQELNALFTTLAYNSGTEVSLEELSKNSQLNKVTIKKYIDYLEAAFLITVIRRIDDNAKYFKRATTFKVFLNNPSMRAALFEPIQENRAQ
ncbi:MAG: ATP-binding protein, partial [Candidatus Margulisiibacteriota bacterium]